jgi:predicted enzyme involved in methoxymalonyl-ACP biosynthesis
MSCRVLGRRVEDAFLSFLGDRARARGAHHLAGRYLPTPKNAQVERFYPDRDFEATGEGAYRLDLSAQAMPAPPEIALRVPANA